MTMGSIRLKPPPNTSRTMMNVRAFAKEKQVIGFFLVVCACAILTLLPLHNRYLNTDLNCLGTHQLSVSEALCRNNNKPLSPPRRIYVCLTGQLPRLELKSKIANFFKPVTARGIDVHVGLVLANSTHQTKGGENKANFHYTSLQQVVVALQNVSSRITVLNDDLHFQYPPVVNEIYKQRRGQVVTDPIELQRAVENHVKQFEALTRCYDHMATSGHYPNEYEMLHRMRDDHGYYQPIRYEAILEQTRERPKTIVVTKCADHGGVNDRGAFLSASAAYDYFTHPLIHMFTQPLAESITNIEKFLSQVYHRSCHIVASEEFYLYRKHITNDEAEIVEDMEDRQCINQMFHNGREHVKDPFPPAEQA